MYIYIYIYIYIYPYTYIYICTYMYRYTQWCVTKITLSRPSTGSTHSSIVMKNYGLFHPFFTCAFRDRRTRVWLSSMHCQVNNCNTCCWRSSGSSSILLHSPKLHGLRRNTPRTFTPTGDLLTISLVSLPLNIPNG